MAKVVWIKTKKKDVSPTAIFVIGGLLAFVFSAYFLYEFRIRDSDEISMPQPITDTLTPEEMNTLINLTTGSPAATAVTDSQGREQIEKTILSTSGQESIKDEDDLPDDEYRKLIESMSGAPR